MDQKRDIRMMRDPLKTLGGTPNRDPCSLWGLIWGLPRDIGVI